MFCTSTSPRSLVNVDERRFRRKVGTEKPPLVSAIASAAVGVQTGMGNSGNIAVRSIGPLFAKTGERKMTCRLVTCRRGSWRRIECLGWFLVAVVAPSECGLPMNIIKVLQNVVSVIN